VRFIGVDMDRRRASFDKAVEQVRAFRARAKPAAAVDIIAWKSDGRR
jgi:hypothetical protein